MKKILILPLILMLTGCPGGPPAPTPRSVFINDENVCFSINKNDTLNYYSIESTRGTKYKYFGDQERIHLSYPDTCIKVKWDYGYVYAINYGLNNKKYIHEFFIDNNGQLKHLGGI